MLYAMDSLIMYVSRSHPEVASEQWTNLLAVKVLAADRFLCTSSNKRCSNYKRYERIPEISHVL